MTCVWIDQTVFLTFSFANNRIVRSFASKNPILFVQRVSNSWLTGCFLLIGTATSAHKSVQVKIDNLHGKMKIFHTLLCLLRFASSVLIWDKKKRWAHSRNVVYKFSIMMLSIYISVDAPHICLSICERGLFCAFAPWTHSLDDDDRGSDPNS